MLTHKIPEDNVIAIPAAAGMFTRWEVSLPKSVGAMAMNLSTIIVALNAQLLRRVQLGPRGLCRLLSLGAEHNDLCLLRPRNEQLFSLKFRRHVELNYAGHYGLLFS